MPVESHWARPVEAIRSEIGVRETYIFPSSQEGMSDLIPNYSFGIYVCKLDAGPSLSAAMPTKIGEFMARVRPIVVNKGLDDMDVFIEEFDAGVILDGTTGNLVEGAIKLLVYFRIPKPLIDAKRWPRNILVLTLVLVSTLICARKS